jgi:hypothetical protein
MQRFGEVPLKNLQRELHDERRIDSQDRLDVGGEAGSDVVRP